MPQKVELTAFVKLINADVGNHLAQVTDAEAERFGVA